MSISVSTLGVKEYYSFTNIVPHFRPLEATESEATRKLYGTDDKITKLFGRQCLLAGRLV